MYRFSRVIFIILFMLSFSQCYAQEKKDNKDVDEKYISSLVDNVLHHDKNVVDQSVQELIKIGAPCVSTILKHKSLTSYPIFKEIIIKIGKPAAPIVMDSFAGTIMYKIYVLDILLTINDESLVPFLINNLDDKSDTVCLAIACGLGKTGDKRGLEPMLKLMNNEKFHARYTMAKGLSLYGGKVVCDALVSVIGSNDHYLRLEAMQALAEQKDLRVVEPIMNLLKASQYPPSYMQKFGKLLNDATSQNFGNNFNKWMEWWEKEALSELSDFKEVDQDTAKLLKGLYDLDFSVSEKASEGLAKKGAEVVDFLINLLGSRRWKVRSLAALTLGKIKNPASIKPLINLFSDWCVEVQMFAVASLNNIGKPAVPSLINALDSENAKIRFCAAITLGKIGDESAIPALTKATKDENEKVQTYSIKALNAIKQNKK